MFATLRTVIEQPPEPIQDKARPRARRGRMVWLGMLLALAAAGIWFQWGGRWSEGSESRTETVLPLETFVVNLNGGGQRAFLRVGVTLGLARPLPGRGATAAPTAQVRDVVLSVLATAQPEEMLKPEGKQRLKEELLKALQERAPQVGVQSVYFTEFLVQM